MTKKSGVTATKEMTLLEAATAIIDNARGAKLSKEFLKKVKKESSLLAGKYGITELQAIFFCISLEVGPKRVDLDDIARFLDFSSVRMLFYADDINSLVKRRLLRYRDAKDEEEFDVFQPVIKALKHNLVYELPARTGLDCAQLFELLETWFDDLGSDAVELTGLIEEIRILIDENPQIRFVKSVKKLKLGDEDLLLLLYFCHALVNEDDNNIRFRQMADLFCDRASFNIAKSELRSGEHNLFRKRLIEHVCVDGIADCTCFCLTAEAKRNLLAEMKLTVTEEEKVADLVRHKSLTPKAMFYPQEIDRQIDNLASFLAPEKYKEIRERMKQSGFRHGFACLFYGGPGTGKTETVYQLAKQTGRDIMVVDVPQIKSKWVGESEKNIKALFERYREIVKKSKLAPILLFNEADAIISTRKNGAQSAVDKMENTIQNIILQEMETLDGIMIATTNLQENLDTAFERRFLYKIKFDKPDAAVRAKIWQQMIPELTESDATTLAAAHDLSGGQIENVARKHAITTVLHGKQENPLQSLLEDCANERLANRQQRTKVGFA